MAVSGPLMVGSALVASANRPVGRPQDLNVEDVAIDSRSGSTIAGWYCAHPDATAAVVITHGIGGTRSSLVERAKLFFDAGYSVLMIDLQAHGASPGKQITLGHLERHDVQAAVDYIRSHDPKLHIGVVGISLGGASALLGSPLGIDALVLESVFPTIEEAIRNRIAARVGMLEPILSPMLLCQIQPRLGISLGELRPIESISKIGCPVLVMSGSEDLHTTEHETKTLYKNANDPKELAIFEGATHEDLQQQNPHQYRTVVLEFLGKHL